MLRNYLAAALRNLVRNRLYASINIVVLAVCFCAAILIVLFVRDEYSYDQFLSGYRDVLLLTETRDVTDRRLLPERWDFSFPDLAAKMSVQCPLIANIKRRFLSQRLQDMYADIVLQGTVISLGAGLAVVIAALGLFGLSAHSAEQRTKEIGIRNAFGAGSSEIVSLMLGDFSKPVLWSNFIAWPAAYLIMRRWPEGFAYRIDSRPWLFLMVTAIALAVAMATVIGHAWLGGARETRRGAAI